MLVPCAHVSKGIAQHVVGNCLQHSIVRVHWTVSKELQKVVHTFVQLVASPCCKSLVHVVLLDNLHDAFRHGFIHCSQSIFHSLTAVGSDMSCDASTVYTVDVCPFIELLQQSLRGDNAYYHHYLRPRAAPSERVVSCVYHRAGPPLESNLGGLHSSTTDCHCPASLCLAVCVHAQQHVNSH